MRYNDFSQAFKIVLFLIDGEEGYWKQVPYREAKDNPNAFRASPNGKSVCWYVRVDLDDEIEEA